MSLFRYGGAFVTAALSALAVSLGGPSPDAVEIHPVSLTSISVAPYSTNTQRFWVVNTGTQANQYGLFANVCTPYDLYCEWSNPFLGTIGVNDSVPVDVKFTAGHAGTSGTISFEARINTNQSIKASKAVTVNARQETHLEVAAFNPGTTEERDLCLTVAVATDAAYECGDLRLVHALPSVRARGTVRTPTLLYNSRFAHPFGLVAATFSTPAQALTNVTARLRVPQSGGDIVVSQGFSDALFTASTVKKFVMAFDASALATGVYPYTLTTTFSLGGTPDSVSASGTLIVVNRKTSPFGAGWWLAGYERIYPQADGNLLWVGGDGRARQYTSVATGVYKAPGIDRPDSITVESGNYIRHLRSGAHVDFGSNGKQFGTTDRLGLVTAFHHDGFGQLKFVDPAGFESLRYTFDYIDDTGSLELVLAPPGDLSRSVLLDVMSDGRVRSLRDPDLTTVSLGYGNAAVPEQITTRTNRRGVEQSFAFDAVGKLTTARVPLNASDTAVTTFCAAESRGYVSTSCSTGPLYPDSAATVMDGPRTDATDVTTFRLDRFGAPKVIRNALGNVTQLFRGNRDFPGLVTRVVQRNGWVNDAFHDSTALITKLVQYAPLGPDRDAVTEYTWDAKWERVTSITMPEGNAMFFAYDSTTGNRLWQQPGTDPARRVTFTYKVGGAADRLLNSVTYPVIKTGRTDQDSIAYDDALGNPSTVRTLANGVLLSEATYASDTLGRHIAACNDIVLNGAHQCTLTKYDAMDRDSVVTQFGDAVGSSPTQSVVVTTTFDAEGSPLTITRDPSDGPLQPLVTRHGYDLSERLVADTAVDGAVERRAYDKADNLTTVFTRRSDTLTMAYDAVNRLTTRTMSGRLYGKDTVGLVLMSGNNFTVNPPYPRKPNDPNGYRIAAETHQFDYNELGQVTSARNGDAHVARTYYANGLLASETDSVRTIAGGDLSQHVYRIGYDYDLNGRTHALHYPSQLVQSPNNSRDSVVYSYDGQTGQVSQVSDLLGRLFAYTYDNASQLTRLDMPGSVRETFGYDGAGRVTGDTIQNASNTQLRATTFTYGDARGKVTGSTNSVLKRDALTAAYSGLGFLVASTYADSGTDYRGFAQKSRSSDRFTYDALGNVLDSTDSTTNSTGTIEDDYTGTGIGYVYQAATGRLLRREASARTDSLVYDAAGNVRFQFTRGNAPVREDRMSYFAADGTLRATDHRTRVPPSGPFTFTFEEYWYDALGRRLLTRTRQDCEPGDYEVQCSISTVRRTVWDGAKELFEIQMPDSTGLQENDTALLGNLGITPTSVKVSKNPFYGRVGYTNGPGFDQPLSVTRWGYADTAFVGTGTQIQFEQWKEPFTIVPHWNMRGQADYGTTATGAGGSECGGGTPPADGTSSGRCALVYWPYGWTVYWQKMYQSPSWNGTLLDQKRDGSHLIFKRNRYYDPATGRFTQEDPIGLAGGLNLYGFAAGDPVNFSDPFGLCPWCPLFGLAAAAETVPGPGTVVGAGLAIAGTIAWFMARDASKAIARSEPATRDREAPQAHHIATDKSSYWTPVFQKMFDKAGMSMQDPANVVPVFGHQGPHSDVYHMTVQGALLQATYGKSGEAYKQAFRAALTALGGEAMTPGTPLNLLITKPQ